MRAMSKAPRSRMSRAASVGTRPAAAIASAAAVSTSSQVSYRRWSLQMRPISGCVYRAIIPNLVQAQPLGWYPQAVDVPEHGRCERAGLEEVLGDSPNLGGGHPLDALQRLVETKLTIEVDLL